MKASGPHPGNGSYSCHLSPQLQRVSGPLSIYLLNVCGPEVTSAAENGGSWEDFFLKILFILERGEESEKDKERNIDMPEKHHSVASHIPTPGNLVHNPVIYPDWVLNWRSFSL